MVSPCARPKRGCPPLWASSRQPELTGLCVFWQPFDEDYLNHLEPPVKHMSFHAYIRKLTGGADK